MKGLDREPQMLMKNEKSIEIVTKKRLNKHNPSTKPILYFYDTLSNASGFSSNCPAAAPNLSLSCLILSILLLKRLLLSSPQRITNCSMAIQFE